MTEMLFGKGPSAAEKAAQAERYQTANRADAEADQQTALAARSTSLRRSLSVQRDDKKGRLGA
jgi:hypothetical protein